MIVINGNIVRSRSDGHDEADLLLIMATHRASDLQQSGRSRSTVYLATRGDGLISIRRAFIRDSSRSFVKNHDRRLAFIRHNRQLAFDLTHLIKSDAGRLRPKIMIDTRSWPDRGSLEAKSRPRSPPRSWPSIPLPDRIKWPSKSAGNSPLKAMYSPFLFLTSDRFVKVIKQILRTIFSSS